MGIEMFQKSNVMFIDTETHVKSRGKEISSVKRICSKISFSAIKREKVKKTRFVYNHELVLKLCAFCVGEMYVLLTVY